MSKSGSLCLAESSRLEFEFYDCVFVTAQLYNSNYGDLLFQNRSNEYIRNYVNYFNIGFN